MAGCPRDGYRLQPDLGDRRSRGTGRFTQLLATHFQAGVIGIDPSRKMIERARQKPIAGNVQFRRASAEALPLEDRSVDLVFLSQVYHHLTDPAAVARECSRVLRRRRHVCIRNTTREDDFVYRHFFPLQELIDRELPAREDIEAVFVNAGFAKTSRRTIAQLVSPDWRSFVYASALPGGLVPGAPAGRGVRARNGRASSPW